MSQYNNNNLNNLIREREREREENLSKCNNIINNNINISFLNQFKSAFSLVELSIVLIIIGLLISAVIGGKALIDEAKIITIRNELEELRTAAREYQSMHPEEKYYDLASPGCGGVFTELPAKKIAELGLLDKTKVIDDRSYASKVKAMVNLSGNNIWYTGSCGGERKNKYGKSHELTFYYGYRVTQGTSKTNSTYAFNGALRPAFCKKLSHKLQSYYGEKISLYRLCYTANKEFDNKCSDNNGSAYINIYIFDW